MMCCPLFCPARTTIYGYNRLGHGTQQQLGMKIFISYGDLADQVTALRLQALAAVNGLTVYVPPAYTRQTNQLRIDPETSQKLAESDVVLGVVVAGPSEPCRQELNTAIALRKTSIVMCYPEFETMLKPYFGANLIVIDPAHPDRTEIEIVQYLKMVDVEKTKQNAILALSTLALGLLIFAPSK